MPKRARFLDHVKIVRSKGREYLYFDTGAKDKRGNPILKRLPGRGDPTFGTAYATAKATRSRRGNLTVMPTLADIVHSYSHSTRFRKLSDNSQRTYQVYLDQLVDQMGVAPADEFTRKDVLDLLETMKPIAANMMLLCIRNTYTYARYREMATIDPTEGIEQNEGGEHEPWPEDLVEAALKSDDPNIRNPVALLYYTAQRIGDVCAIRWSDYKNDVIDVTQQKTGKELDIPVHRHLREILDLIPRDRNGVVDIHMTILADEDGKPAKVPTVRSRLQKFATKAGFEIVPHGLRKNAVNALLECECSTGQVSAITGQSLQLVEHYAKRRNNRKMGTAAILKWERNTK